MKSWKRREKKSDEGASVTKAGSVRALGDAGGAKVVGERSKAFEANRRIVCYNCQETGRIAAVCRKPKVVFSYVDGSDENLQLLKPSSATCALTEGMQGAS